MSGEPIRVALLDAFDHGFGVRDATPPMDLLRPKQVHGTAVVHADACTRGQMPEADAIVSDRPGVPVAVVTADCVPVLVARSGGGGVAAIHAGWRGLAAGVIEAGVAALRALPVGEGELVAAIGPHIGACCYEVDAPVLDALALRFEHWVPGATTPTRPGHARLDLGALAHRALEAAGVAVGQIAALPGSCTSCDAERFHSYRRDGSASGRLVHFIRA